METINYWELLEMTGNTNVFYVNDEEPTDVILSINYTADLWQIINEHNLQELKPYEIYFDKDYLINIQLIVNVENENKANKIIKGFYLLAQSPTSNKFQKRLTQRKADIEKINLAGDKVIISQDFKLYIKGYNELKNGINQSAAMLLDALMIEATRNGLKSTLVNLPVSEYMGMRGLVNEKETRMQVKRDIDALERVSFEYRGTGKHSGSWLKVNISGGTVGQKRNGDIIFRFNQDFFDCFMVGGNRYLFMYFPYEALQGNIGKNPHKYYLARKISEHKRMNLGKPNENIISVKTLLAACPNFPTYDDVMSGNRNLTDRIIGPFERDMDALSGKFISWDYNTNIDNNYKQFISATVTIHWENYPDTTNLKKNKVKQIKRQIKNNSVGRHVQKEG